MQTVTLRFSGSKKTFTATIKDTFTTYQSGSHKLRIAIVSYRNSQDIERNAYINLDSGLEMQYSSIGKLTKVKGL